MKNYTRNHYVPEWYQYRFFDGSEKEKKFFYLDLNPEIVKANKGRTYTRRDILRWGPPQCFYKDNLYTTTFLGLESTEIEEKFFGKIDSNGKVALEFFAKYRHPEINPDAFYNFLPFMSVQKLRTPKGLAYLKGILNPSTKNDLLIKMQELHTMHCAIWAECVWCIVDASKSETKFIISDNPVTVYNQRCFPGSRWCRKNNDPPIWLEGTHTIFPLSYNKALFLTNLSWVRNPYGNPLRERPHPNLFRDAMFRFTDIQVERYLSEEEVVSVNYILKNRAQKYIAATKKEWLFPEKYIKEQRWNKIGESYLLMPDPRSMSFSSEILIGRGDKLIEAYDEYGRKPWHRDYKDENRAKYEWETFHAFQGEYARKFGPKRKGLSYSFDKLDDEVDSDDYHAYQLQLEHRSKQNMAKMRRTRD